MKGTVLKEMATIRAEKSEMERKKKDLEHKISLPDWLELTSINFVVNPFLFL